MANFRIPLNYKEHVSKAVHNLSCIKRTTAHAMTAIPLYFRYLYNGDEFYFKTPQLLLQSQPTFAPLMGTYRLRVEWYFDSDANRYGWIDNNDKLSTDENINRRRHSFKYPTLLENNEVEIFPDSGDAFDFRGFVDSNYNYFFGYGGLSDYMGIAPGTMRVSNTSDELSSFYPDGEQAISQSTYLQEFRLDFLLTYLNVIRTYHVNTQFTEIPYINAFRYSNGEENREVFDTYNLKDLDELFKMLRYFDNGHTFELNSNMIDELPEKWRSVYQKFTEYATSTASSFGGLFCTQYEPDLYRNLLSKEMDLTKAVVTPNPDGSISIERFRFANRLQMIFDRISTVGGRRSDVVRARWGITSNKGRDIPQLIAVQSEYIDTNIITSNNSSGNANLNNDTIPGDMAGNINQRNFPKGTQKFVATESGVLMALVTITPIVDYCQNVDRSLLEINFEDSYSPQMAQRGFESVPLSDYSTLPRIHYFYSDSSTYLQNVMRAQGDLPVGNSVVGKQIAYLREMTDTNRVHGEFATEGYYNTWVLGRRYMKYNVQNPLEDADFSYTSDLVISPYGNPLDWQYPFAVQDITSPNFFLQVAFDVKAVRPIGRRYMPTLG